jgi:hypothetical protein
MSEPGGHELQPKIVKMSVLPAEGVKAALDSGSGYQVPAETTGRLKITVPNKDRVAVNGRVDPTIAIDLGLFTTRDPLEAKVVGNSSDYRPAQERLPQEPEHMALLSLLPQPGEGHQSTAGEEEAALVLKGILGDEQEELARRGIKLEDIVRADLQVGVNGSLFPSTSEFPKGAQTGANDPTR